MKRILSLALVLVMVLSMVPATVFATETDAPPQRTLPTAKVSEIKKDDLTFAMNFRVNSVTEEQLAYYGNWYADFELTINKKVSFDAEGTADGWLSGQYDEWSYDWVNVPFGKNAPVTIEAGETVKIMAFAAKLMDEPGLKYTFKEVYETVKDFNCGVYFDDEFLTANPDLVVKLELKMYNPANEAESYVIGETYTYVNPIVAKNTTTGKVYTTVNEATMDAQEGQTVVLLKDSTEMIVSVFAGVTLDLNGHALAATYVTSFGNIIDSSADNSGLLAVSANKLMIRNDNAQIPIRTENGYLFAEVVKFNARFDAAKSAFGFQPFIEAGMLEFLKNGSDATGVTIQVQVTWKQKDGYRSQNFVYNEDLVNYFLNSYNPSTNKYKETFTLTLSGAENFEELTFTALVVSNTGVSRSDKDPIPEKPAGNVTTDANNQVVNDVTIGSGSASAQVPSGTQLESGVNNVTLDATMLEESASNITLKGDEQMLSMNVHVNGVAANNTKPILVTLTDLTPAALNQGNLELYHVENGETVKMTRVYSLEEVDAHNEYYYDIATGTVTMALATFSEVAATFSASKVWEGTIDTSWYNTTDKFFTIYNADQLAGLSAIVGGMAADIERDSFKDKTITLMADINLNDTEGDGKIFYPIGYWNNTLSYEHVSGNPNGTAVSSGFYPFEGTFDGNGNTIANFYQNTWEMFGDYNDGYSGTPNYYRDGMGLFGKVYGGTVKNLTIEKFTSDGEFTTTGCVAAYADCGATFENIAITNCNPRVYNIGNGGIVGCVGWYAKEVTDKKVTFRNITVDNTNKISALWGSWDVACGGIVGQYYPTSGQTSAGTPKNAGIDLINCHVAAQIDVYNDVCANYQYYAYRYSGMLIGSVRENETINGHSYPKMDGITASGCTVHFGDWNDYYYCELVANSLASYTHDHQMSRLTQVKDVDAANMKYVDLDGVEHNIPAEGRVNYVVVTNKNDDGTWKHGDGKDYATCYHFVDGAVWNHKDAGEETVNGETVLKEDKQLVYREFNNLVTGYGWGVTSMGIKDFEDTEIVDSAIEQSIDKFTAKKADGASIQNNVIYTIDELFKAIEGADIGILGKTVHVFVSPVNATSTVTGEYIANREDWTAGTLKLYGKGEAVITITDYYYCNPLSVRVSVGSIIPNGTFELDKTIYEYHITEKTGQLAYWSLTGGLDTDWDKDGILDSSVIVTNEWSYDGEYSLKFKDNSTTNAANVAYLYIPVVPGTAKTVTFSGNYLFEAKSNYIAVLQYTDGTYKTEATKAVTVVSNPGEGSFERDITIHENTQYICIKIAASKGETGSIYVDNLKLTINGSDENLIPNPSFEELPKGVEPEETTTNTNGWDMPASANDLYLEIVKDSDGNNVLHLVDNNDSAAVATHTFNVKSNTTYQLTYRFKGKMYTPVSIYNSATKKEIASVRATPTADWTTYTLVFTTEDFSEVYIRIGSGLGATGYNEYFDDFALKEIGPA